MKIVKRNGQIVNYNRDKIAIAINKANNEVNEENKISEEKINQIIDYIESLDKKRMLVEDIQDIIENKLMEYGKYELAKKYIVYRYTRTLVRKKNSIDESILGLIKQKHDQVYEINPNKNAVLASTQRDLIAGEVSKDLTKRILLPSKIVKAHEDGEIYFHDADYFLQSMIDSLYLDISNMLEMCTVINNKLIETPKTFVVACLVTTQIIDSIACNQYGGVSLDVSHLSKYLRKSKEKLYNSLANTSLGEEEKTSLVNHRLRSELNTGIQLIQYQLNTLMTTNGQYPSVTLFLNTDVDKEYKLENELIIEEILKQRKLGIKNAEGEYITPRFPKLIYVLNENNNLDNGEYAHLTKLAIECSKNGGYPDYLSSKVMKKHYKNNVVSPIGEHNFLIPYKDGDQYKFEGRFNQGLVTINIAQVAILSQGNENKFWNLLDDKLDIAKEALMCKHYALLNTLTDTSPLHWTYGGASRLNSGKNINELLRNNYSILTLGFMGVNEATYFIKGESADTEIGHQFALKIVKRLKNTVDRWAENNDLGFVLYAGEDLNVSYYFANIDKKRFSNIEGITDKGYYSDSYSLEPQKIELYKRLELEKDFIPFCNGGCYNKINIATLNNDKNSYDIINYIYNNLLYCEFNHNLDSCKVCGYKGRMITTQKHSYECPNCSNKDKTKFHIHKQLNE